MLGVIAVPLFLGLVIPAKPLGAAALGANGLNNALTNQGGSSEIPTAPQDRNVLDWVKAFKGTDNVDQFAGQAVNLIGFVYHDPQLDPKMQIQVVRFVFIHCAADASALGLVAQTPNADSYAQDQWVRIKGAIQISAVKGQKTPIVVAQSIEKTDQPVQPYLYP
jgi:uncharacterized repeat protein (TIGR03943 family)